MGFHGACLQGTLSGDPTRVDSGGQTYLPGNEFRFVSDAFAGAAHSIVKRIRMVEASRLVGRCSEMTSTHHTRWRASVVLTLGICLFGTASHGVADDLTLHTFETQQLSDTYFSEGANAGDVNGDGQDDVVYGPYWFAGPDYTSKFEIYEPVPQDRERYADNFFSWVYDFNGDGWDDVLVVGFPGTPAHVYENPTGDRSDAHWEKHAVFDWVSNESPQWVDLVGDERPELVCTRDGFFGFATVNWEEPFGRWEFHPISEQVTAKRFGHGLGIGDINGDGRMDIIHAKGWYEQPATHADASRWLHHPVSFSNAYGGAEMYAYDVDGDGDNDVITSHAAHDFGLAWYEQVPGEEGVEFKHHLIMGSHPSENRYGVLFSELHSLALRDIDGDGLKDIVTGKTYYSHHQQSPMWDAGAVVYWFKLVRNSDGVDWIPFRADDDAGIGRQVSVVDVNSDGLLDIVVGGMKGAHVLTHKTSVVDQATWEQAQPRPYTGQRLPSVERAKPLRGPKSPIDARTGRVPGAWEGEALKFRALAGQARPQPMANFSGDRWSGNSQLWWTGGRPGDALEIQLPAKDGTVDVEIALTCARDYAIVQLTLDEQPLGGPIDLFNAEVITTGLLSFPAIELEPGSHKLTMQILGANPKAQKSYMCGIDFIRLKGAGETFQQPDVGIKPTTSDGRVLNLDFETGTLEDWTATGNAFAGQPIKGDTVAKRRPDMRSAHVGDYWIGGHERGGDAGTGTLSSVPFFVTHPYATFLMNGGHHEQTRVELVRQDTGDVVYKIVGTNSEVLRQIVVDLRAQVGREIFVRLVDEHRGGWGHLNFDHFRFHETRPAPVTPPMIVLVDDEYPHAGLSAAQAAAAMSLPDGFSVVVGAAEPDVKQPIAMALDDRGRVWIAEAYEYPNRAQGNAGRDRILIFEDTDGNGTLDDRKVFADGLNLVSGLEVGLGGVWVGAAPYLLFLPDQNGDDVPDSEPQILLDGWGYQDTHETLNAFIWGPDGWLYGCHGVFTHSRVGKPGTPDEDRIPFNAGVWRYHPTRHEFEVFAHGTSNPWGVDFNDHGQAFATACVIPHLFHIIQGARYQRQAGQHFNPYTYRDIVTIADHLHYLGATPHSGNSKSDAAGGGHAHAGAMIYLGGRWPAEYRDQIIMNNIHGQRLNADILKEAGSGYVGGHGPDFLLTGDQASQILNLRYGPDGNAWMIDWYDMQACHRREADVHDRSNGRIYKIVYGELQSEASAVNVAELSDLELSELTLNINDWWVRHARRQLQARAARRAIDPVAVRRLKELATTHPDDTRRLRAAWALHVTETLDESTRSRLLSDASPYVRVWTVQLALEQLNGDLPDSLLDQFAMMAREDDSPVVRLYLASGAQKIPHHQRWSILEALASHAEDAGDHNLPLMYWYAAEPLADVDPQRALAWAMSAGESIPLLRQFMLRRIGSSDTGSSLAILLDGLSQARQPKLQVTFLEAIRSALRGQRRVEPPQDWPALLAQLSSSDDPSVRLQAQSLGVTFGDPTAIDELRQHVADENATIETRQTALTALLDAKDPELPSMLMQLLKVESPLVELAIQGLAQYDDDSIPSTLLAIYPDLTADQKRTALGTLAGRAASGIALLRAIEDQRLSGKDLTSDLVRQLQFLKNEEVDRLLEDVWGTARASAADKLAMIAEYKDLIASTAHPKPDPALGRAVFAKTCMKCHILYGLGNRVGPDLTGSNRSNLDYVISNIADPSAVMAKEYQPHIIVTEDGRVVTGVIKSEDQRSLTLQTADAVVLIPKNEIEERVASQQSMMPDDQLKLFSTHEVRSLVAYLQGKQQTPLLATADNAASLFNGKDLSGWTGTPDLWSVEDGELVGRSNGLRRNEWIVSDLLVGDFKLTLDVKLVGNSGNSGIQFRSRARDGQVSGYQADIGAGWWGKLYEEHGRALLWDKSGEEYIRIGEWNTYQIHAEGSQIRTFLNGQPCVDLDDPQGATRGIIALQLHSGGPTEVRFRNFVLEVLDDPSESDATRPETTGG